MQLGLFSSSPQHHKLGGERLPQASAEHLEHPGSGPVRVISRMTPTKLPEWQKSVAPTDEANEVAVFNLLDDVIRGLSQPSGQ